MILMFSNTKAIKNVSQFSDQRPLLAVRQKMNGYLVKDVVRNVTQLVFLFHTISTAQLGKTKVQILLLPPSYAASLSQTIVEIRE